MGYNEIGRIGRGQSMQDFEAILGIGAFIFWGKDAAIERF